MHCGEISFHVFCVEGYCVTYLQAVVYEFKFSLGETSLRTLKSFDCTYLTRNLDFGEVGFPNDFTFDAKHSQ